MDFKHIKPIRITAYILTVLFFIGAIWFGFNSRQVKINHLQQEVNILYNYKLNEPALREQIVTLENDNTKLKQDVQYYKGKYLSDELYIDELESRFVQVTTYANLAEAVLLANGIEWRQVNWN